MTFVREWGPEEGLCCGLVFGVRCLTAETIQGTSLAFQGIDDVHGSDGLPLGVLGVGDGITDHVLQEHLEDTTGLLVDEARDTLYSSTASQTTDRRLGDTLDVITEYLPVTLSASLSESLSSLAAARHDCCAFGVRNTTDAVSLRERSYIGALRPVRTHPHRGRSSQTQLRVAPRPRDRQQPMAAPFCTVLFPRSEARR